MSDKRPGYLGIQFMNGYSHTCKEQHPYVSKLVFGFDIWLEHNFHVPSEVSINEELYEAITQEIGYKVATLGTVIGDFPVSTHKGAPFVKVL